MDKNRHFLTPSPPRLVHVVIEWPLRSQKHCAQNDHMICAKLTAKNPKNHKRIAIVKDVQNCPQKGNTSLH